MSIAPDSKTPINPATPTEMMRLPVGAVSPLWGLFAGAAVTGAAWWWMTRWARPENLEAMFGQAAKVQEAVIDVVEAEVAALPEAVFEAPVLETAIAAAEPVTEVTVEAAEAVAEPILEAVEAAPEVIAETVEAAPEMVAEAAAPAVTEAVEAVEAAPDTVAEALAGSTEDFPEPVGGEFAPISPVVAALAPEPEPEAPSMEEPAVELAAVETAAEMPTQAKRKPTPKPRIVSIDEG